MHACMHSRTTQCTPTLVFFYFSFSVFVTLVLAKELQKLNYSEEASFRLIFKDFYAKSPNNENWETIFEEVFGMSVNDFYVNVVPTYTADIETVLPSENLTLQAIFQE